MGIWSGRARWIGLSSVALLGGLMAVASPGLPASAPRVDFVRDVQPIFKASCLKCHGPIRQRGQLRLDSRSFALHGGVRGLDIVPGDAAGSRLVQLLESADSDERMPARGGSLPPEKVRLIRAWIDQGALWPASASSGPVFEPHWAYRKAVRPAVPAVRDRTWIRNPIDAFVLARLEAEGLAPSPEAAKTTLIRRVSLDLTGLPPGLDEVDAFLADARPDAYERLVDRLLASPHYGERWAQHWLDLARYADTDGGSWDRPRSAWPYRDWVIRALNRDLPFDQFTVQQIAGDLLPGATVDDLVATGFHRNTPWNEEDGVDAQEMRWESLLDRVDTTATVWLGTTLACARCHNHKYDPFTQRDHYQFLAFFDNAAESDVKLPPASLLDPSAKDVTALILVEHPTSQPTTHVRVRGSYLRTGEKVSAGTPGALAAWRPEWPGNRLGLAYWLVDPDNPLVARVTVNRLWAQLFGRGLVETVEDFGTQGARPSHAALLDWLATELGRLRWSTKALHRTIVTSATYRQSSRATPALLARDPQNISLARGPRFRLDAEVIRDVALTASGLLSRKVGGPSVFPPQPDDTGFIANNKASLAWVPTEGENRYRRGLYTYRRRTAPFPMFATFDAPNHEVSVVRRPRTNTPLQALAGLNDPALVEAARALARRMVAEAPADARGRVSHGFRLCLSRLPKPDEVDLLVREYERQRSHFEADPAAGALLVAGPRSDASRAPVPELAAWTVVANVLLNLDETLTKE